MTGPAPNRMQVIATDIDMPFMSMVVFIVKWTIAAIPAMIVLFILAGIAAAVLGGIFHSMFGGLFPRWPAA
jgi:hypothetical protein